MAASILSHDHIDAMLTYAITNGLQFDLAPGIPVPFCVERADQLGQILLLANAQAVRTCSNDTPLHPLASCYAYRPVAEPINAGQAARLSDHLDIQCCETGVWDSSLAARICWGARPPGYRYGPEYDAAAPHYRRAPRADA